MNKTKSEYLLLFRGKDWDQGISPEEVNQRLETVMAWYEALKQRTTVKGGQPLAREGRTVVSKNGKNVDGPFAETKEAVGGYMLIEAENIDEAVAIALSNPTIAYGVTIEVRPVLDECPIFKRAKERAALASA